MIFRWCKSKEKVPFLCPLKVFQNELIKKELEKRIHSLLRLVEAITKWDYPLAQYKSEVYPPLSRAKGSSMGKVDDFQGHGK